MKRFFLPFLGSLLLITLTGCEGMDFTGYQGEQRAWPAGTAFADGVYDVPVYRGWPEKPYDVLGFVQFAGQDVDWNRGDLKLAARKAKEAGGDALILMPKGADPSPTASGMRQQLGITEAKSVAVVVTWK